MARVTTIGVRELKNRLSECIRMVREGGEVYVTHRGEVVAELRPPSSAGADGSRAELRRLSTAVFVRNPAPEVRLHSFDDRIRRNAEALGFDVAA